MSIDPKWTTETDAALGHHVTKWLTEWMAMSECDRCSKPIGVGNPLARTSLGIYVCQTCGKTLGTHAVTL